MDENLEKLLYNLEPEIDKKCFEIKQKKQEEKMQRAFILGIILVLCIPSLLIMFNVNIWGFIISSIIFTSIALITMLPLAFKEEVGGVCYE